MYNKTTFINKSTHTVMQIAMVRGHFGKLALCVLHHTFKNRLFFGRGERQGIDMVPTDPELPFANSYIIITTAVLSTVVVTFHKRKKKENYCFFFLAGKE